MSRAQNRTFVDKGTYFVLRQVTAWDWKASPTGYTKTHVILNKHQSGDVGFEIKRFWEPLNGEIVDAPNPYYGASLSKEEWTTVFERIKSL